jgi:Sulfatase
MAVIRTILVRLLTSLALIVAAPRRRMGMSRKLTVHLLALFLALTGTAPTSAQQPQKPNVVFILADNVGYADLGSYGGGELRGPPTPRLDQLAREGLRLTQFLVEPACTPSRAALMIGQYSIRNGLSRIAIEGSPYVHPTGTGPQRQPGIFSASAPMAGYPKGYNIEMDPHDDLVVAGLFSWVSGPSAQAGPRVPGVRQEISKPACTRHHTVPKRWPLVCWL